nr:nuclear transport factor 2 family protein [Sulfitobacter aestuariivivens]
MVLRYFTAVDAENLDGILALLTPDCVFTVETHGVDLRGHDEIAGMFHRLWSAHEEVRHRDFRFVSDPANNRIAVQFLVENVELDGSLTHKSNCNFFDAAGAQFDRISVYMAGANTLHGESD